MLIRLLLWIFGDSWRTTILGYSVAISYYVLPILQGNDWTWKGLGTAAAIAVFSRLVSEDKKENKPDLPDPKDNQS